MLASRCYAAQNATPAWTGRRYPGSEMALPKDAVRMWTFFAAVNLFASAPGPATAVLEEEKPATTMYASVGDHVIFNCKLDFPHDIVIPYILRWNKEGQTVFSWYEDVLTAEESYNGRVSLVSSDPHYGKGSVNLTSIRESDSGWYECIVFFPNRTPATRRNGTWFQLLVDGGTLLAVPPINQTTIEGEDAHFQCITKDADAVVTWLRDGEDISTITSLKDRYMVSEEGSLTINPTDMSDPGEYTCVVINSQGERQTASAFLNVQYKAKVIYSPREVYLPFGRPGILDCHFRSNPPLTNLRWEKDGFLFDPYNVQGVFYRRNGSLFFSKVDETHQGKYTCTPINELGSQGPSTPVEVIVQKPPKFLIKPHNLYLRRLGDTLEMPCDAGTEGGEGSHRPAIVWFRKDGSPLPVGRITIHNGNLTIENLQEDDRGHYQCVASNEAATISSDTELMLENVTPRAPYNLTASSDQSSVTLKWVPGFVRPMLDYSIWYRPTESAEWRTVRLPNRGSTEAVISGLSPGRTYEFMVLSQDQHGDGMFSKAMQVKTKGDPVIDTSAQEFRSPIGSFQQIGPPRNVSVVLTAEGYMVTWEPPEFGHEELKLYTVRWTEGPREILYGRADTTDTWFLVPLLEEDTSYVFQVVATSSNDYQAASSKVLVHVPGYRRIRAISVGVAVGVVFLALAAAGAFYVRRLYVKRLAEEKEDGY